MTEKQVGQEKELKNYGLLKTEKVSWVGMKKKNYCPPDVEKGVKWVKRMFRRLNKE